MSPFGDGADIRPQVDLPRRRGDVQSSLEHPTVVVGPPRVLVSSVEVFS